MKFSQIFGFDPNLVTKVTGEITLDPELTRAELSSARIARLRVKRNAATVLVNHPWCIQTETDLTTSRAHSSRKKAA